MNAKLLTEDKMTEEETVQENEGVFTHKFKTPVMYDGETIDSATFNWDKLTGEDSLAIEKELRREGTFMIIPSLSGEYIFQMMMRACEPKRSLDFFHRIKLLDYNKIRDAARDFLTQAE